MKHTIPLSAVIALLVLASAAQIAVAQIDPASKPIVKNLGAEMLPGNSVKLLGDPCDEAADIGFGQNIAGVLLSTDCHMPDGSYADFYVFNGTAGQQVTVNLESVVFDAYLGLASMDGTFVVEDDDGGDGTNARIIATLPSTGVYVIMANTVFPATPGDYFVNLQSDPPCTFTLVPTSAEIPGDGGTFTFELITQPSCYWRTESPSFPYYRVTSAASGYGSTTVTYLAQLNNEGQTRTGRVIAGGQQFDITQPTIPCSYAVTPTSMSMPGAETYGQFSVATGPNCRWNAFNNDFFIWIDSPNPRTGPGVVDFHVIPNNGAEIRTGTVSVNGATFTVNQDGLNCTFAVSPTEIYVPAVETTGTIEVTAQPGCFSAAGGNWMVQITNGNGTGSRTINYRVYANPTYQPRSTVINIGGLGLIPVNFFQAGRTRSAADFDGDGKTDVSIFRPDVGEWWYLRSSDGGNRAYQFGASTDAIAPADFTGDGKTDVAFWRPSTGEWYILRSEDGTFYSFPFGADGDIAAPADYDGDGKADAAVYRPSNSTWYVFRSSDNGTTATAFGSAGDKPVPADYDGDGKADVAIYRPSAGEWWYLRSSDGANRAFAFGASDDQTVPADYTGDGKADIAFFRPSSGEWFVLRSEDSSFYSFPWGTTGDLPTPGDYDGDGKMDPAVFRPSNANWYAFRSTGGTLITQFGTTGDRPAPNAYVR